MFDQFFWLQITNKTVDFFFQLVLHILCKHFVQ